MARRKTKIKAKLKKQKKAQIPDHIGNLKSKVVKVDVDNPYFSRDHHESQGNRKKIVAFMNMQESIAAHWFYHKKIQEPELKAATKFRAIWESASGSGASAIDYSIDRVDGGGISDPIQTSKAEAVSELAALRLRYGQNGYDLLVGLCGQCQPITDLYPSWRHQQSQSEECRRLLKLLSVDFGYRNYVETKRRA